MSNTIGTWNNHEINEILDNYKKSFLDLGTIIFWFLKKPDHMNSNKSTSASPLRIYNVSSKCASV